jgi:hypothetical protein
VGEEGNFQRTSLFFSQPPCYFYYSYSLTTMVNMKRNAGGGRTEKG